jgi:hypothetical protein
VLVRATGEDSDTSPLTHRHGTAPRLLVVVPGDAMKPRQARHEEEPSPGRGPPRSRLRSRRRDRDGASSPEPVLTTAAAGASSTETMLAAATARGGAAPRSRSRPRAVSVARASSTEPVLPAATTGDGVPSCGGAVLRRQRGRSSPARPSNCSMQCRKGRTCRGQPWGPLTTGEITLPKKINTNHYPNRPQPKLK